MSVQWTKEQQKVIDLRDSNILVSAAAGSGKTAVLVERIITRLTKDASPLDVDRLLIVTFTEAAAAEMKERIGAALEKALEQEPENLHLQKQATLIHTAKIMTIHSFCLSVIRDYFHTIDLDPGFRIAEEGELKLLRQDVVKEVLERHYETGEDDFLTFVENFAVGREDSSLEGLIMQLYDFSRSYPEPEVWLEECAASYHEGICEDSPFMQKLKGYVDDCLDGIEADMNQARAVCFASGGPYMYESTIDADWEQIAPVYEAETFAERYAAFQKMGKWARMSANRDKAVDEYLAEYVKNLRKKWKAELERIQTEYFFQPLEEMQADFSRCIPVVDILVELLKEFAVAFREKKTDSNLLDFDDMEHLAVEILTRKEDGRLVPSEVAKELQEQFEEVMIDEYQDSNLIQETILRSVSRESRGENNLFMVGDVKQSIYRFRLSRPELFMEKYDTYTMDGEGSCQRIDLHKNFRSRAEVIDFANAVFKKIMIKAVGNVEYDEDAALYKGAEYPESRECTPEILIVDTNVEEDEQTDGKMLTAREMEARAVAERIHALMEEQQVYDKGVEKMRPLRYGDIVILTRSLKGWSNVFVRVLKEEGIPAYADAREGYFGTLEIGWMMDYLRVLDNYRQDLPLTAILKSPFGKFTNEELAVIRNLYPELSFHEAVLLAADCKLSLQHDKKSVPEALAEKLRRMFRYIEHFRKQVSYMAIHDLLWNIMRETGFWEEIAAMPGGEQRTANLEMLMNKAKAFESTSYKGLFHFVRYVEQLKEYNIDYGEADIFNENTDAVRVMSIHKSKGLEFPVVIAAGMGKKMNMQDIMGNMVIHPELGVGMLSIDLEKRTASSTLLRNMIRSSIGLENLGEELRVLYVALTRAKEKLILTGTLKNAEEKLREYSMRAPSEEDSLPFLTIARAHNYFDWLLPAVIGKEDSGLLDMRVISFEEIVQSEMEREMADQIEKEVYLEAIQNPGNPLAKRNEAYAERLDEQFSYHYKMDEQLKMKYTVSELKKHAMLSGSEAEMGERLHEGTKEAIVPKFVQEEQKLTGAARGSVYHKILELLDLSKDYDYVSLKNALEELHQQDYLTQEMLDAVWAKDLLLFFESGLGKRMQQAAKNRKLYREQPFVFGVPAKEANPETDSDEEILIQGIIDAYFEEADGLVIVDYKTDRAKEAAELVNKYQEQLKWYERALEQLTGKKVKEKSIYSFALHAVIPLGM